MSRSAPPPSARLPLLRKLGIVRDGAPAHAAPRPPRGARVASLTRVRPRRPRLRTIVVALLATALLVAGWFWLRDSSLVGVRTVTVTGLNGGQAQEIERALDNAGRSMTTLHVRRDALDSAVAPFSIVKRIEVTTDFPHGMRVHVVSNVAVGAVELDGRRTPVTADGTLLRDVAAADTLPLVPLHGTPTGSRLNEGEAIAAFAVLGAAPTAFRHRVERVATTRAHGLELQLRDGPALWFGDRERLTAKWAAVAAVLADPQAAGAAYVDVAAPERPAVGGLPDGAPATSESDDPDLPDGATVDPQSGALLDLGADDSSSSTDTATPDPTAETTP
ncbi:cell division protein FtsQ/DivIB [Conexibacter sp. JD483]|uniref:cell division protein FtsQ/DivIB n=1 Tax=unclassified Conexibacter TaxID=2627773 RepID=UPI00271C3FB0|nr:MULTISPECIES: cell division protein FtsQ/DivIB [unclassified Conexibacter]MDO8184610.1 cell division protein FtsQ/DivIB [Conexibacter sp. CPCC 205706]MDO8197916.1 cell division protein FtsQ/DivIB [Conexibacter sp. CPCC 205762]MDR9370119.1 cell division protein FtsQ/DivIB [Conexibacter sp. JD483]